jgi:hypothetical protein
LDGPLAAKSCAAALVIFDDATFEGDSTLASERFDARAAEAIAALRAVEGLTNALQSGTAPGAAIDHAIEAREDGAARDLLVAVRDSIQNGAAIGTTDLLKTLEEHYLAAFAHLPEQWQARVERRLSNDVATLVDPTHVCSMDASGHGTVVRHHRRRDGNIRRPGMLPQP